MAVPAYTNDLTTIVDFDGTPSSPTVAEASTWSAGRSPEEADTDYPIQGSTHCTLVMNTTGKAGVVCDNASSFSWTSGDYLFGWIIWLAPGAIAEIASGGLAMICGSSASVYKVFYIGGKTYGTYPYGGWQNFAVDPTQTADETSGSPSAYYIVGGGANVLSAVAKGSPLGFDVFRYGRGILYIDGGSSGDGYATFTGMASANDATSARWGLFQAIPGGYKQKGVLSLGENSLCEFVDANKSIVIDDSIYVSSNFNRIEIHNTNSVIDWSNVSIQSLCTVSPGQLEVIDNADVDFDGCVFTDMDIFGFLSNSTILNSTFRRCGIITQGSAVFTNCEFDNSSAVKALVVDDVANVSNCTFISDGTGYALEGFSSAGDYTFTGLKFNDYAVSNGSTGNEAIHVLATSGTVNLGVGGGGTATPSVHTEGATVNIVTSVTLTMTVKDVSGDPIVGALAYIDNDDITPFIMNTTTNESGVATTGYVGAPVNDSRWRVRKYGYKKFKQLIDIEGDDISLPVTMTVDPQQT